MRILMLQDNFPPQVFGGGVYLACGMQKAGYQVFVITTCQERSQEGEEDYQGLRVFRIFANYHDRWRGYLSLYNPQTVGRVGEFIQKINPDVVHAHNIQSFLSYHCLKTAKRLGKPVFFTARDAMSFSFDKLATKKYLEKFDCRTNWYDHLKQSRKRYNPLRNLLIKGYLGYVDQIFAISQALKEALGQNGIQNVEVSRTSIDVDDWQVSPELVEGFKKKRGLHGKRVIFFGGRVSALKGLEQINQAVIKIKERIPETVLLIAGGKEMGWLSGNDIKAAYHSADIAVTPSVCFDAFPRTNLEAMACRKPVVATCYGGSKELVQDGVTGFIVNPFNAELMAAKITELLKNPAKAKQFGEAGYERVKKYFNLSGQVAQTIAWYQKFINH